jgi:hypothetical protein
MAPREPGWPLTWLSAPLRRGHTRGAIGSLRVKNETGSPRLFMRHEKVAHAGSAWLSFIGIVNVFQSDMDLTDADLERIPEVDRRVVDPPIRVEMPPDLMLASSTCG